MKTLLILIASCLQLNAQVLTNLPVAITTQALTNIVEGSNEKGCATCEMLRKASHTGLVPAISHPYHTSARLGTWRSTAMLRVVH